VGNWYACFSCEVDPEPLPPSPEVAGLDLGLKTFAMLSTGEQSSPALMRVTQRILPAFGGKKARLPEAPERCKALRHSTMPAGVQQTAHRLCASGKPEAGQPLWSDRL
jgi:transposase